jgi:hypothetical protein
MNEITNTPKTVKRSIDNSKATDYLSEMPYWKPQNKILRSRGSKPEQNFDLLGIDMK